MRELTKKETKQAFEKGLKIYDDEEQTVYEVWYDHKHAQLVFRHCGYGNSCIWTPIKSVETGYEV